jgi:putative endonuclease
VFHVISSEARNLNSGMETSRFARSDNDKREIPMTKNYYVYIMTNKSRTFYVGMTNNLERRVSEHKQKLIEGFTKRYNITLLVYYETFSDVRAAIAREKQVKDWRREKKMALIESMNPTWKDLSADWSQ